MLRHAARAVCHLAHGYGNLDLPLASWAARNLVELRIWSRYASMSIEILRRFHDDSLLDKLELAQLQLQTATALNHDQGALTEAHAQVEDATNEVNQSNLETTKRLQIKHICKEVGAEQFYKLWFGMLSKCAHPTPGLLIEVETGREAVDTTVLEPMFVMALRSATEILNTTIQISQLVTHPEDAKLP
jgi:hypothetical protein